MYYWYFTYVIKVEEHGLSHTDSAVTSSLSQYFPLGDVSEYFHEEFGDNATFSILSAFEINEEDYLKFVDTLEVAGV